MQALPNPVAGEETAQLGMTTTISRCLSKEDKLIGIEHSKIIKNKKCLTRLQEFRSARTKPVAQKVHSKEWLHPYLDA
jgi:hypothetical protein